MKINIFHIVIEHYKIIFWTGRYPIIDFIFIVIIPIVISLFVSVYSPFNDKSVFSVLISVFSIFAALLINAQLSLFGVIDRKWRKSDSEIQNKIINDRRDLRRLLIREINTSISYLILLSCFTLVIFFIFYTFSINENIESFFSILLSAHFLTSLITIIKRIHAVFDIELQNDKEN